MYHTYVYLYINNQIGQSHCRGAFPAFVNCNFILTAARRNAKQQAANNRLYSFSQKSLACSPLPFLPRWVHCTCAAKGTNNYAYIQVYINNHTRYLYRHGCERGISSIVLRSCTLRATPCLCLHYHLYAYIYVDMRDC